MNNTLIQQIIIYSLILGAIFGILVPIPYLGIIILFITLLLSAPIVMVYMIMAGKLELTTVSNSIITGALTGFFTNITFSILFSVITVLLSEIFKYNPNLFLTAMITQSPIWLLITFIIFTGILFATTNAFSGFMTYYIINLIRDLYEQKHKNSQDKL